MLRRLTLCGIFVFTGQCWFAPPVDAQSDDANLVPISFRTTDHASIQGSLHKSTKPGQAPGRSPVVILMHGSGDDPASGDYPALAKILAEKGFNTLRFDFRGHGRSTAVANDFWSDPINANYLRTLARKKPIKTKVDWSELKAVRNGAYFPRLADDLMAARASLDQLNDNGEVSTSSVYLVGARDSATIGMLYLAAEWSRPQKMPQTIVNRFPALMPRNLQNILGAGDPCAGWDVAGAVWLSAATHPSVGKSVMQGWVQSAPELRERTPMMFLYGEKDNRAKLDAKVFRDEVLVAQPRTGAAVLPLTISRPIEKTDLNGIGLLKDSSTEKVIVEYLVAREMERKSLLRIPNRGYSPPPPAINLPYFGVCR